MKSFIQIICLLFIFIQVSYSQWWPFVEQNSGTSANLTGGSQPSWGVTWICGYNGTVIKTSNYGTTWSNVSGNIPSTLSLVNICGINDSTALTAGYINTSTFVYRTSNNGLNWVLVFTQANGFINAVWMRTATTGFMAGNPVGGRWSLWKTYNGGLNWDSTGLRLAQSGNEMGFNNSLFCMQDYIWFGTNNARIYFSSNYGAYWQVQPTSPVQNIFTIHDGVTSGLFAGGSELLQTTNSGTNWTVVSGVPGTGNITGITEPNLGIFGNNHSISGIPMISRQNKVYIYPYWVSRWDTVYTAPANINYLFKNNGEPSGMWLGMCTAVRMAGGLAVCGCQLNAINSMSDVIPKKFRLYQNYPNPFNPVTMIRFELPDYAYVKIAVFDMLGKEISVLADERLKGGIYEVQWDASRFASGIYFCKLITNDFTDTKKMILIK